jgi:E3 ubiquitin-protein ligase UBR4
LTSILAPVVGLFQSNPPTSAASASVAVSKSRKQDSEKKTDKPLWLAEAELMQDEVGLTCAVCQEGRTFQPSELLGLYCYVKKVAIPMELCGSRACIDGTNLLKELPATLPLSLLGTTVADDWFPTAKAAASNLSSDVSISFTVASSGGRRSSLFTTTVSAGNGIHLSCHRRARQADRSHPKAPKTEWDGAALRNNRVSCNVIFPLVTCRSSDVPLVAVESALTDHMTTVTNILGTTPKSTLWTVLHDVRLLLLRISYGESLSSDCGGGSIESNCKLLFYQFLMADMYERNAQVDQPEHATHARALSCGLLAACAIVTAKDLTLNSTVLTRGIADAATMGAITSVIFHNTHADGYSIEESTSGAEEYVHPHSKRQWLAGKDYFLQALIICAGRRHARCVEGSGCQTSRSTTARHRSSSFAEWDEVDMEIEEHNDETEAAGTNRASTCPASRKTRRSSTPTVEDFQNALRPMIMFYAIMDQISAEYTSSMSMQDVKIDEACQRMVATINDCQRSRSIHELFRKARVTMDHSEIIELLQKGMVSQ